MSVTCILLAAPRTGTTVLGHAVTQAFEAAWPQEIFNEEFADPKLDYRRAENIRHRTNFFNYRNDALRRQPELSYPSRENVALLFRSYLDYLTEAEPQERFLLDVKYSSIHHLNGYWQLWPDRPGLLTIIKELGLPVVHLRRRNLFSLYCSLAYAEATGVWATTDEAKADHAIVVDTRRCKAYMEQISATSKHVGDWLSGHRVFELEYESMLEDEKWSPQVASTFSQIYGEPPAMPLVTAFRKATPPLARIVRNADEVLLALRGTPFLSMAEEALHGDNALNADKVVNLPYRQLPTTSNEAAGKSTTAMAGAVILLSTDPLVLILRSASVKKAVGLAEELGQRLSERPITFLIPLAWHCNEAGAADKATDERRFKASCPQHELIFLGDTLEDVARLAAAGASAFFASGNMFVSESVFRPLPGVDVAFDAMYNARPVPWKRHWLAAATERVAYICYVVRGEEAAAPAVIEAILARGPGHVLINPIVGDLPKSIARPAVNEALARCAVGLCFSEVEGAMRASMEYLLAGLPVVSTPSLGGRDVFFDPDYCIIAEPRPEAIRQAVEELRDRKIPRDYVRARTLAKLVVERNRFVAVVEEIKARHGVSRSYTTEWQFSGLPIQRGTVEELANYLSVSAGVAPA